MSDLFIAKPDFTQENYTIFGKNSHREANESQAIIRVPALKQEWKVVDCSFIQIPQVDYTNEIVLSKPFHSWGAEMGVNEHGLCIGNTLTQTKLPFEQKNTGLTGHDLLRLALERTKTAEQAVELITELLAEYGQNVYSGYKSKNAYYCNSFLITDYNDSYLLETVGKEWGAIKIKSGYYALSSVLTLEQTFDLKSENLIDFAHKNKWIKKGKEFSMKEAYGKKTLFSSDKSEKRRSLMENLLQEHKGKFNIQNAMDILSYHNKKETSFNPSKSDDTDICRHTTKSSNAQTNGSMITELRPESKKFTCWLTGTSAPCISLFKPVYIPGENLYQGVFKEPTSLKDDSLWWKAEIFHRNVSLNYQKIKATFDKERLEIQQRLIDTDKVMRDGEGSKYMMDKLSEDSIRLHLKKIMEWNYALSKKKVSFGQFSPSYKNYINKLTSQITPILD